MCGGSDPFQVVSDALASVDPGPAIGSGLADVDKFVNNEIPGGWKLPAALAVAYATGYVDPSLFASEMGTELTSEAAQQAFFDAVANGATSSEAMNAGLAIDAANAAGEVGSYMTPELMGPSYGELGVTGVEGGLAGPTYGELGYSGITGAADVAAADAAAYAAANNLSLADAYKALSTANQIKNLATSGYNLLTGKNVPKAIAGAGYGSGLISGSDSQLTGDTTDTGTGSGLKADLTKANPNFKLNDFDGSATAPQLYNIGSNPAAFAPIKSFSAGGDVESHNPTFFSPGGLASMENTYVKGEGDGTSDSVAAMLANGEFVIPADVVSRLGNGSNDAGAGVLDEFLSTIRAHAQKHDPKELPPDSKGPLAYMAEAKKKAKA